MQQAYLGEAFEQEFEIYDARDRSRRIDSGTFEVIVDGDTVSSGSLTIGTMATNTASFRFNADHEGVNKIILSWMMGQDAWTQVFLINVVSP